MRFIFTLLLVTIIWGFTAPVLTGCGGQGVAGSNAGSVENRGNVAEGSTATEADAGTGYILMDMLKEAVADDLGEGYWPDKQLTKKELETETGIGEEWYTGFLAEKQKVETDIDMMIILEADPAHLTEIETSLNAYRDSLMVKYKERPQELGKVSASRIEIIGNFICFVQLGGDTSAAAQEGDENVIAQCRQENEKAVEIIEKTIQGALDTGRSIGYNVSTAV